MNSSFSLLLFQPTKPSLPPVQRKIGNSNRFSKHGSLETLSFSTNPSLRYISIHTFLRQSSTREKKNSTLPSSSTSLSRHQSIPLLLVDIVYKHTWHGSIHEAVIYVCPRQSANQPRQSGDGDLYSRGSAEGESAADEIGRVLRSSRFASSTLRVSLPFACICTRYVYTSCNTPPPILRNGIVVKM